MALFRNTADLKLFTDVHKQTDWPTLKLYTEQAELTYILPVLGEVMYSNYSGLMADPANASKSFAEIFTDPQDLRAYNNIAVALANYTLFEAFPFLNTAVGDIGVSQQNSKEGTTNPAAQWRYESRRWAHLSNADRATDQLLAYLEFHADYFKDWRNSEAYTITKDLFIDNSIMLSKYIGTNNSRRAYQALRPHIRMAEKKYIIPALGQKLFSELKEQLLNNSLTALNSALMEVIREGLAWAAYYEGLPFLVIKFNTEGVQVISANDGINNKLAAGKEEKDLARSVAGHNADSFLGSLKKYLLDNAYSYPLFYNNSEVSGNNNPKYRRAENNFLSGMFRV